MRSTIVTAFFSNLKYEIVQGIVNLYNYSPLGAQFVRDFAFQCLDHVQNRTWKHVDGVATSILIEKMRLVRALA